MSDDIKLAGAPTDQRAELEAQAAAQAAAQEAAAQAAAKQAAQAARVAAETAAQAARQAPPAPRNVEQPSPDAGAVLQDVTQLRAQAETERERLQTLGNEYDARLRRERERDRVSALRSMGAVGSLTDTQLLAITPDVDPHAPGGKAQLDEWRENNDGLFHKPEGPKIPTASELIGKLPAHRRSASGVFDEKYLADLIRRNMGN
jgi:hypothetical protein